MPHRPDHHSRDQACDLEDAMMRDTWWAETKRMVERGYRRFWERKGYRPPEERVRPAMGAGRPVQELPAPATSEAAL